MKRPGVLVGSIVGFGADGCLLWACRGDGERGGFWTSIMVNVVEAELTWESGASIFSFERRHARSLLSGSLTRCVRRHSSLARMIN